MDLLSHWAVKGAHQGRQRLSFRAVNRAGRPGYDPGLQRHHILPRQLQSMRCFGLLLPSSDDAAVRIGLPLHRGPHRDYNALVIERFGQIESSWSAMRLRAPEVALIEAYQRLELLQRALRRRLLAQRRRLVLNRRDPLGSGLDFSEIDAMAASLWPATEPDPQ